MPLKNIHVSSSTSFALASCSRCLIMKFVYDFFSFSNVPSLRFPFLLLVVPFFIQTPEIGVAGDAGT